MPRTSQGPLMDLAGKPIAKQKCPACNRVNFIKVNKSGWPYVVCPHHTGCGSASKTQSNISAHYLVRTATSWQSGYKALVFEALRIRPLVVEPVPEKELKKPKLLWQEELYNG